MRRPCIHRRALWALLLGVWLLPLCAQPSLTTINTTLYQANGRRFSGSITCTYPTFTTADGYAIPRGSTGPIPVNNGTLSTTLIPTDALSGTSANTRYTCTYALSNGRPVSPPLTETWSVPTATPVTSLDSLRAVATAPLSATAAPATATFITKGSEGSLSAEFSLGSLADNSLVTCDVTAAVCTPRAGIASDLLGMSGWPSGLDLTELGYVNGVTAALQTQLDAKQPLDADLTTYAGITPSANVQSLLGAASYADMRTLLDLEAGTDFYSISAADTLLAAKAAGASNLTTAGSIPYISASGTLNQDAGQLHWDATNNRMGIGTSSPGTSLEINGGTSSPLSEVGSFVITSSSGTYRLGFGYNTSSDYGWIQSTHNGADYTPLVLNGAASTGNVLVGTTTNDGIGKFQVAGEVTISGLKTTGAAGSKAVVCVDTTTGRLYASSTSTDCSN